MIKFKEILNEVNKQYVSKTSTTLESDEHFKKILEENCSEYLKNPIEIYRGIKSIEPYLLINPVSYKRKSISGPEWEFITNYISDYSEKWKEYPKRNRSLICTTDEYKAIGFAGSDGANKKGAVYQVIPFNNSKWGVCAGSDIIQTTFGIKFSNGNFSTRLMPKIITTILSIVTGKIYDNKKVPINELSNFEFDIKKVYKRIELIRKDLGGFAGENSLTMLLTSELLEKLLDQSNNVWKRNNTIFVKPLLEEFYSPEKHGFKLEHYNGLSNLKDREIWTDSKCLLKLIRAY